MDETLHTPAWERLIEMVWGLLTGWNHPWIVEWQEPNKKWIRVCWVDIMQVARYTPVKFPKETWWGIPLEDAVLLCQVMNSSFPMFPVRIRNRRTGEIIVGSIL